MARLLVIGDIHGCFDALHALCEAVELQPDDTVLTLGDYVNRGPNSREVLDFLIALAERHHLVALQGNHDLFMRQARHSRLEYLAWQNADGEATLRSYGANGRPGDLEDIPEAHWHFLDHQLLPYFETDSHLFVHASVQPDLPLHRQPESALYWQKFSCPRPHCSGKVMICGHTAQKSGLPVVTRHAICLDTWVVGKGWLSCLDVDSGLVTQADQSRRIRRLRLSELEHHSQPHHPVPGQRARENRGDRPLPPAGL